MTSKPLIELDAAIAAIEQTVIERNGDAPPMPVWLAIRAYANALRALPTVTAAWPDFIAPPKYENQHPAWEDPALPDFRLIWATARECGYAIGLHGSMKRDCDMIAALPDPLGAEWMRREAVEAIQNICNPADIPGGCIIPDNFDEGTNAAFEAVKAIPSPTDDALDRAAMARPKVRALVGACRQARNEAVTDVTGGWFDVMCAALAALKEGK